MPEITDADHIAASALSMSCDYPVADRDKIIKAFAAHRETAYQAGMLAGARAMDALIAYSGHDSDCPSNVMQRGEWPACECGYSKVLEAAEQIARDGV